MYSTELNFGGHVLLFGAIFAIIVCLCVLCFSIMKRENVIMKQLNIVCSCFTIGCAILAFLWQPAEYHDLYRHFIFLDQIRESKLSFWEFLTAENNGIQAAGKYSTMIGFNVLRYFVAVILNNNHWLPGLCVLFDCAVFQYITLDWMKKNRIHQKWLLACYILMFSFMPFLLVASGVRNAFATSLVTLALYLRLCNKKSMMTYFILCAIAATFHPSALLPAVFGVLFPFIKGKKSIIIMCGVIMLFRPIASLFASLNIPFLSYIGSVYLFYIEEHQYKGEMLSFVTNIIVLVVLLVLNFTKDAVRDLDLRDNRIYEFLFVYIIFLLATTMLGTNNIMLRSAYALGPLALVLITPYAKRCEMKKKSTKIGRKCLFIAMLGVCLINALDSLLIFFAQIV